MKSFIYGVTVLALAAGSRADTINWPGNDGWIPLHLQGESISDPVDDIGNNGHPHLDIVGNAVHPSGYLRFRSVVDYPDETEDQLLLRLRLNGSKNRMKGSYQVFFDTDGDEGVEWVLQLNTTSLASEGQLQFGTAGGETQDGMLVGAIGWSGSYAGNVHWTGETTGDGSQFGGDDDYFLDVSMPWEQFSILTGVKQTRNPFRILVATGQQGGKLSDGGLSEPMGSASFPEFEEFGELTDVAIPEPATCALLAGPAVAFLIGRRLFAT